MNSVRCIQGQVQKQSNSHSRVRAWHTACGEARSDWTSLFDSELDELIDGGGKAG